MLGGRRAREANPNPSRSLIPKDEHFHSNRKRSKIKDQVKLKYLQGLIP